MAMAQKAVVIVYELEGDYGLGEESVRRMSGWRVWKVSALTSGRPPWQARA
jgi:hypothetical protein